MYYLYKTKDISLEDYITRRQTWTHGSQTKLIDRCVEMVRRRGARCPARNDRKVSDGENGLGLVPGRIICVIRRERTWSAQGVIASDDSDAAKQEEGQIREGAERPHRKPYGRCGRLESASTNPYGLPDGGLQRQAIMPDTYGIRLEHGIVGYENCAELRALLGSGAYIDDILVNESVVSVHRVKRHLAHYGLTCKTHERAADGAQLLGLKVWGEQGKLMLKRDNDVGVAADELTRRSFHTAASWLATFRIAATYIKRKANDAITSWDEVIESGKLRDLIQETALAVWVDASSQEVGVALEIGGSVVEDVTWLSPDDAQHINMAELDAVIKGFNMAFSWQITKIRLMTD
ncbi:hypothetical protein T07_8070 [Trichinella nelsoni]|uniref:DUF7047 domain-containing protein n=1 Tax=Trichinella nelsoni TaxID=6336 RepID=A0A0V0S2M8_9BILA|nr:hypothetical protein T07_8070 [Trichinella nelsoni]